MKHYGIWLKNLGEWVYVDGRIFWATSRAVALAQFAFMEYTSVQAEVREFPES